MTQPQPVRPAPPPPKDGLPWLRTALIAVVMLGVVVAAAGIWYIFFRPAGPAAIGTGAPVIPSSAPVATPALGAGSSTDPATAVEPASNLDGTWAVDASIGSFDYDAGDFSGSWVGYRVQEELASVGGAVAVGRTPDVSGTITIDGSTITAADLTAELTTLTSDQSMRDGQLGRQGIQTDQFPTATFVLTQPIDLGSVPAAGQQVSVTAMGDLTIHGVTKRVEIPLNGALTGDVLGVSGSLTFTWDDFGMTQPESMRVVSLANDVTMELQVFFSKEG